MSTDDLTNALADCLARIEAGESAESAVDHHESLRAQLAPLVAAASAIRSVPPVPAPPALRAALAQDLARREALRPVPTAPASPWPMVVTGAIVLVCLGLGAAVVMRGNELSPLLARSEEGAASAGAQWAPPSPAATPIRRQSVPPRVAVQLAVQPATSPTIARVARAPRAAASAGAKLPRTPPPAVAPTATGVSPTATATPAPAGVAPAQNDNPTRHDPTPIPSATAPDPATSTATAASGATVTLGGYVKQGEAPLPDVIVDLFEAAALADCAPEPSATPVASAVTGADGHFALAAPTGSGLFYRLSARGGPSCLPRRWHTGENSVAAAGPCEPGVVELEIAAGAAAGSVDVLYPAGEGGCGAPGTTD